MSKLIEQVARNHNKHLEFCDYGNVCGAGERSSKCTCSTERMIAALRELSAKLDTRWEAWRKQLLDAWAKDHRATMTALLEGGPAAPPMADTKEEKMVEPKQCAICGFPLQASREFGCVKGDCSQRPFPDKFYDFDRAEREYKRKFDDSHRPAPAQATREQLASRVAALEQRNAAFRKRLHHSEGHNQYFFRCESAWCNPTNDFGGDPAMETLRQLDEQAQKIGQLEQRIADAIAILDQAGDNRDAALARLREVKG